MAIKGKYLNTLLIKDDEFYLKNYRITLNPENYHCILLESESQKGIKMIILRKYKDLLTKFGPTIGSAFAWLKKPLKQMDKISKLKKINVI